MKAFQDLMPHNHCFGCGPGNEQGLQLKSYWSETGEAVARFNAPPHLCAAPEKYLNGGIIGTLIDCHSICAVTAKSYRDTGREIGEGELLNFVTGKMDLDYVRPVKINRPIDLVARVVAQTERKSVVHCSLSVDGELCAKAEVTAIKVSSNW